MDNKELAVGHIKQGVITAMILFGISLGNLLVGFLSDGSAGDTTYLDPWTWVTVATLLVLMWGMTRKSRMASVLMLLVYLLGATIKISDRPSLLGIALALVIVFFLAKAVYGCFAYHRAEKNDNPDHKPTRWWMWAVSTPLILGVLWLFSLGLMSQWGWIPATHVKSYQEVTDKERQQLLDWGILNAGEQIDMYYSFGLYSYREGGSVLTDQRLIGRLTRHRYRNDSVLL